MEPGHPPRAPPARDTIRVFLTPFCPWEGCACRRTHTLPLCGQSHVLGRFCDRGAVQCSPSSSVLARGTRWSFSCPSPAACTRASRPVPRASVCLRSLCQDGCSAQPCRSPGSAALACVLCHRPDLKAQPFQKVGTARTSALEAFGSLLGPFSWLVFLIQEVPHLCWTRVLSCLYCE